MDDGDDEDLNLIRASASLLLDLEQSLPRVLFKPHVTQDLRKAHSIVRQRDLDHVVKLIEPFQGDPQLLDAHLKTVIPQIADALLQHLARPSKPVREGHVDLTFAASRLIYTFCKVRGRKVISGLLHNEPRYLELIVASLEHHVADGEQWQVQYALLLWLSHLLLTPFNLESISAIGDAVALPDNLQLKHKLPDLAHRSLQVCLQCLGSSAVSREIAALALVRLTIRPDMQKLYLPDAIVDWCLASVGAGNTNDNADVHSQLGIMHFLAGIAKSADVDYLLPKIFQACEQLNGSESSHAITTDAVGRKLLLKTMSTIMMTSLRALSTSTVLAQFLSESGALETTIETQLQCLTDRDSLVRNAAAKTTSNIMLTLDASMAQEVLDALFSILQDDMANSMAGKGFQTANAFAWHGVVLALSYALFKRSVPVTQLPLLIEILLTALSFEQRTATGSITGTNVRDAANFGLWSLARRSTTAELGQVNLPSSQQAVITTIATNLLQAACLDPVGNIRRGSSAALQELVGRHPNEVPHGIALVQAVDFVAVGLRQRALIDVAASAMALEQLYFDVLVNGIIGWRGLGSSDVSSRDYAAASLEARAAAGNEAVVLKITNEILVSIQQCPQHDIERMHGLILSLALWVDDLTKGPPSALTRDQQIQQLRKIWDALLRTDISAHIFEPRALRANLASAVIKLISGICKYDTANSTAGETAPGLVNTLTPLLERLLTRYDDSLLEIVPSLIQALLPAASTSSSYDCIELPQLSAELNISINKPTLHGAARALAVAASVRPSLSSDTITQHIEALHAVCQSSYVDWRTMGQRAMGVLVETWSRGQAISPDHLQLVVSILAAGMKDYTIDRRGDVGSLVRIEALKSAHTLCTDEHIQCYPDILIDLHAAIARLSLEKLNRVRTRAAQCRSKLSGILAMKDYGKIESEQYFAEAMAPLWQRDCPAWTREALLVGLTSCAGSTAEHLLQSSRAAICHALGTIDLDILQQIIDGLVELLITATADSHNIVPTLEVIDFLLQARITQRLLGTDFKWRRLLAQVQKAHYKSTDILRLLAVLSVYSGLAEVPNIRQDVLKKLFSMLRTIPYPKVRAATADTLFLAVNDEVLKHHDWHLPASKNAGVLAEVYNRHITT